MTMSWILSDGDFGNAMPDVDCELLRGVDE
jgi:hypothetical protein